MTEPPVTYLAANHSEWRNTFSTVSCAALMIAMLSNWRYSGFQVFCGNRLRPEEETDMENLARYIIRASFFQERMQYLTKPSKVVCRAKDGTDEKVFDDLEWLDSRLRGSDKLQIIRGSQ